jgi:hypothetical protein
VIQYFLERVHPYQRVERVVRDIPASKSTNKPSYAALFIDVLSESYQKLPPANEVMCAGTSWVDWM